MAKYEKFKDIMRNKVHDREHEDFVKALKSGKQMSWGDMKNHCSHNRKTFEAHKLR